MKHLSEKFRSSVSWLLIVSVNHAAIAPVMAGPSVPNLPSPATGNTSYSASGNVGSVNQTAAKQSFNWNSFDIGNGYKVVFNQPNSGVALNRIGGGRPSEIRGALQSITPDGKGGAIYLINQNGIIFGSTAQINVGSLVASTFDVDDNLFQNSSISEAINQQQQTAFAIANNLASTADLKQVDILNAWKDHPDVGNIEVESGASIKSTSANGVMIFAPVIKNAGTIETPDGQAILAASNGKVYLTPATGSSSDQPLLRGFLVEVDSGGTVENLGKIIAERGNITLLGMAINQNGELTATTAAGVGANGSIRLLARDHARLANETENGLHDKTELGPLVPSSLQSDRLAVADTCPSGTSCTGTVTFGANSITQVLPDSSSKTQPDAANQSQSVVEVYGKNIALDNGAEIHAPSGLVQMTAKSYGDTNASITLAANAKIDVSGTTDTVKNIQDNVLDVKLVGTELADVPLQRDGVLSRADVKIDATQGTSVANISGQISNIQRTASERLSSGGSVKLTADNVTLDPASTIDVSGGKVTYKGGDKTTTYLHGGGKWTEISQADPNIVYDKIKNVTFHKVPGYVDGKDAGSISISAGQISLGSNVLKGGVTIGQKQRDKPPQAGSFDLSLATAGSILNIVSQQNFRGDSGEISDRLFANSGLGNFTISNASKVNIAGDADIVLADKGKLSITATDDINVEGKIHIAGGTVALNNSSDTGTSDASITVGSGGLIDVSGKWINEKLDYLKNFARTVTGGGIDLKSGNIALQSGSKLLANGGAWLSTAGKLTTGSGGNISLLSNYASKADGTLAVGKLQMDGTLQSYSVTQGGKLSLTANGFIIDGSGTAQSEGIYTVLNPSFFEQGGFSAYSFTNNNSDIRVTADTEINLVQRNWKLDPKLFSKPSGTDISKYATVVTLPDYLRKPVNFSALVQPALKALDSDTAKAETQLVIEKNAKISTEAGGQISLEAQTLKLIVDGKLFAPAGVIKLVLDPTSANTNVRLNYAGGVNGNQAIVLGANSELNANAAFIANPVAGQSKYNRYNAYSAGAVSVTAQSGYVVAEQGSKISVDGAAQTVDVKQVNSKGTVTLQSVVQTADAGTIHLESAEGMLLDGTLSGKAADVSGAKAGRLEVVLNTNNAGPDRLKGNSDASTIHVKQSAESVDILTDPVQRDSNGVISGIDNIYSELAASSRGNNSVLLFADSIKNAGFDQLQLQATNTKSLDANGDEKIPGVPGAYGRIQFDGDVNLYLRQSLELNANSLAVSNGNVVIGGAYLLWSNASDGYAGAVLPQTSGAGHLTLTGDFIDLVGSLTTLGVQDTKLISNGDIRARNVITADTSTGITSVTPGSLTTFGDLTLQAQQIYPPSGYQFTFAVNGDANGTLSILPQSGTPATVLSAGGSLTFNAPNIVQNGTVKAPLGSIVMNATDTLTLGNGSLTSVALDTDLVPYGLINPANGKWSYALPQKSITLQAQHVNMNSGSTVDLSGGGDVYEYQFIAGPGGSKDVLDAANSGNSFAIVPTLKLAYAPLNDLDSTSKLPSGWTPGQTITINRNGVDVSYTVLPARYAMLPDAMLVTPSSSYNGMVAPGYSRTLPDGTVVVAGKIGYAPNLADNSPAIQSSVWSAFTLQTHDQVYKRSQYDVKTATDYFAHTDTGSATGLARDGGFLKVLAQADAIVAGSIRAAGADGGRGGGVDFQASDISVVHTLSSGAHSGVELLDTQLSSLDVDSILLGGSRQFDATSTNLTTAANTITVADDVALANKEILFAAKDSIQVGNNASITAAGGVKDTSGELETINVAGQGTVLRLSSVRQADIERTNASQTQGTFTLAQSATLSAPAIAVDVSKSASIDGNLDAQGGSLAFSAPQISIGSGASSGLVLQQSQVNNSSLQQLILNSSSNLDFYSPVQVAASDSVIIGASAIRSFMNASDAVSINAGNTITLTGKGSSAAGAAGNAGTLNLAANQIVLKGSKGSAAETTVSTNGFSQIAISARDRVVANGNLKVSAGAPVAIATPLLTSDDGANFSLISDGVVAITGGNGASTKSLATESFGSVSVKGSALDIDSSVVLPGGIFKATATGADGVNFGDNAQIDVAGRVLTIGSQSVAMDGGTITVAADTGSIATTNKTVFDVSATASGADAGSIGFTSPNGALSLAAQIHGTAASDRSGGSLSIDAKSIDGLNNLLGNLSVSGFNNEIALRQREGDLIVDAGSTLHAQHISLEADGNDGSSGNIDIGGSLDASGASAGDITVAAGNNLILRGTATLSATASAADERGGKVALSARSGYMDLQDGSTINVSGGANGAGGTVDYRVSRTQSGHIVGIGEVGDGVAINHYGVNVIGARRIDIEAVKMYGQTSITQTVLDQLQSETQNFMAAIGNWVDQNLGAIAESVRPRVVPGVEIDSNSNLAINTAIDLYDSNSGNWRYSYGNNSDIPGVLTLRAAGNLQISNNISDGFDQSISDFYADQGMANSGLISGSSWSLNLIGGADLNAANVLAVKTQGGGDISLSGGVAVRTGTGSINVASVGSLSFADTTAAIYTAGASTPWMEIVNGKKYGYDPNDVLPYLFLGPNWVAVFPDFPTTGGDVSVKVGGNIAVTKAGINKPSQTADWLFRVGNDVGEENIGGDATLPAAWGVVPQLFGGGIATLGGGNIDVRAGGNISYVQIAAPTTGKQVAELVTNNETGLPTTATGSKSGLVDVEGGGNVNVKVGGNIASSSILIANGIGRINADGLVKGSGAKVGNLIGIGDAVVDIDARNGIAIQSVYNPTVALQTPNQAVVDSTASTLSEFFTYSERSAINLISDTGDIQIQNDSEGVAVAYGYTEPNGNLTLKVQPSGSTVNYLVTLNDILPPNVSALAGLGSISLDSSVNGGSPTIFLYPTATSQISLIAGENVTTNGKLLVLGDGDTSVLPALGSAQTLNGNTAYGFSGHLFGVGYSDDDINSTLQVFGVNSKSVDDASLHAATPLHNDDAAPLLIAAGGDVNKLNLRSPKAVDIEAGKDITASNFTIQNIHANDVSQVVAGNDITGSSSIQINGPGRLDVLAGRNIDLGSSAVGIQAQGNLINPNLSEVGATISLFAGLGDSAPNYQGFIDKYISTDDLFKFVKSDNFGGDFISYVSQQTNQNYGQLSDAIAAWQTLDSGTQQTVLHSFIAGNIPYLRPKILGVYFDELKAGGENGRQHLADGYARAYRAIDTLFPNADASKGDILITQSGIKNNGKEGGDINLLVPNGKIDVGIAGSSNVSANSFGIVVTGKGSINGYTKGDINVNRSKIIVQDGGNLLLFARNGNIDAGRGSRSALQLPAPILSRDSLGNLVVTAPPAISGSGIQAGCSSLGCKPGDVNLYAPNGVIDAGDAGITSAGNIFLGALTVVHADVINAAGSIAGLPPAPTVSVGLGGGDVAASAAQSAQETAAAAAAGDQSPLSQRGLALLTVDILGYGSSLDDDEKRRRQ